MEGDCARAQVRVAVLMRGALYLTAARTPYRRGGLAFPAGTPLTVAIQALTAVQLGQLIGDPLISVLVGQDDGRFVAVPELADMDEGELQAFINAAPVVEIEAVAEVDGGKPSQLQAELDDARQALGEINVQLTSAQGEVALLRQERDKSVGQVATLTTANQQMAADLDAAEKANAEYQTRIGDLEANLANALAAAKTSEQPAGDVAAPVEASPTKAKSKAKTDTAD